VWEVAVRRVWLPSWPDSQYDPADDAAGIASGLVAYLVLAPFFWLVVPLARVLVELPFAVGRSLFSRTRWVEATCADPAEIRIVWRTSRDQAEAVASHVIRQLAKGYADLVPAGVVRESMTKPPGFDDLRA
jgi:hypothetical protein